MPNAPAADFELLDSSNAAALSAHADAIQPLHLAAWRGPVVTDYQVGAVVWLWDHYNTATIVGPGSEPGTWLVSTPDADGEPEQFAYPATRIRPALKACVFTWASHRASLAPVESQAKRSSDLDVYMQTGRWPS